MLDILCGGNTYYKNYDVMIKIINSTIDLFLKN